MEQGQCLATRKASVYQRICHSRQLLLLLVGNLQQMMTEQWTMALLLLSFTVALQAALQKDTSPSSLAADTGWLGWVTAASLSGGITKFQWLWGVSLLDQEEGDWAIGHTFILFLLRVPRCSPREHSSLAFSPCALAGVESTSSSRDGHVAQPRPIRAVTVVTTIVSGMATWIKLSQRPEDAFDSRD